MTVLFYIFIWIFIAMLCVIVGLLFMWMWTGIKAKVPFVPVPRSILPSIHKALGITKESIVYDLGCGDARVLLYSAGRVPEATYIGIENGPFPVLVARIYAWWHARKTGRSVQILDKDFFTQDLSNATHIFLYLYPNIMDDLLPKFDRELKKGTRLVSVSFKFTQKQPITEIDLERTGRYQLARKLYIYEF